MPILIVIFFKRRRLTGLNLLLEDGDLWSITRSECQYIHKMEAASSGIMPLSDSKYVMIWTKMYFGFQINCTEGTYKKTEQVIHFVSTTQEYAWL